MWLFEVLLRVIAVSACRAAGAIVGKRAVVKQRMSIPLSMAFHLLDTAIGLFRSRVGSAGQGGPRVRIAKSVYRGFELKSPKKLRIHRDNSRG
jgi:hypothetical protein